MSEDEQEALDPQMVEYPDAPDEPDGEEDEELVEAYESVGDVPAEEPPPDEGDAGPIGVEGNKPPPTAAAPEEDVADEKPPKEATRAKRRRVVQFKRTLKKGARGPDVVAVKRALRRAKCYRIKPASAQLGPKAVTAIKKFQKQHKLKADGVYGVRTHRALMRYFDNYGALLMSRAPEPQTFTTSIRQRILAEALWGYNNRYRIWYSQVRPMRARNKGHRLPQTMDCSEFATLVYKRAGASDPNGMLFNGYGYTGTLGARGRFVALSQARPGDLVFYGRGHPWHHVAVYVGHNRVVSHGSDGAPYLCHIDYRGDRGAIRAYLP